VQFPRNTRSLSVVSNLNLTGPLKWQGFSAFEPVEQIGKLCSPAKNSPKPGICSENKDKMMMLYKQYLQPEMVSFYIMHPFTDIKLASSIDK